jgi:hypothetical protein
VSRFWSLIWIVLSAAWGGQACFAISLGDYGSAVDSLLGVVLMLTNYKLTVACRQINELRRAP